MLQFHKTHAALAVGHLTQLLVSPPVTRIFSDCESALTVLSHDLEFSRLPLLESKVDR
ncbi:hypothetical protein RchiOBHm_Chr1g0342771 [Rosa chinensis]|uniref:Uncharacterized protein n=1 Tax=Rosa chinensis TaxID=74649 RepID=A0A2P6SE34_ROSCH|nr:hypothetical protein RchiOBHm_Chr1g0342771 [Rosa chinensis]